MWRSKMDFKKRIEDFQSVIRESSLDAVFVSRRGALAYFTGAFIPWCSALYIPAEGEAELITQRYDINRVISVSYVKKMRGWAPQGDVSFIDCLLDLIRGNHLENGRLGFEMETKEVAGVLTAMEYLELKKAFPNIAVEDALPLINSVLVQRDEEEVECLRRAAEAADYSMKSAVESIYVGMTETELAGVAEYAGRKAGSMFNWSVTGTEIGSGYRQSYENCWTVIPSDKHIQYGDMITLDIHTMYNNYLADLSLNAVVGAPTPAQAELGEKWRQLGEYLISLIKPGEKCSDIAKAMIQKGEELGVDRFLMHSFGHGLGLEARIPPTISPENEYVLRENTAMVAVVQLTDPAVGGLRLEMPCMIRADGAERLCKSPIKLYEVKV